ncbi:hypothetical protein L1987_20609 [Smallanthus sonchifolius]|uniref:Uncharacterized protein n=1 Tax=Smallanthus sonchifolius TaxID=185202 RepID=A0ACB9ISY1_9ASTR|nr:hypothetical protein L1987_20609 [Smallanthus sonchifolius]
MPRNAKEAKTEQGDRPIRTSSLTEEKMISFNVDDMNDVLDPHYDGLAREVLEANEQDVKEVSQDTENPDAKILVGSNIPEDIEKDILNFLKGRKATFAWKHEDITGISRYIMKETFAPERNP